VARADDDRVVLRAAGHERLRTICSDNTTAAAR
jgi:hypothetical protein